LRTARQLGLPLGGGAQAVAQLGGAISQLPGAGGDLAANDGDALALLPHVAGALHELARTAFKLHQPLLQFRMSGCKLRRTVLECLQVRCRWLFPIQGACPSPQLLDTLGQELDIVGKCVRTRRQSGGAFMGLRQPAVERGRTGLQFRDPLA